MNKPVIVIKLKWNQFNLLASFIQHVLLNMTGNFNFTNPIPNLLSVQNALEDLTLAIGKWGPVGGRGSHTDYLNLTQKSKFALNIITQLGGYCMSVIPLNIDYSAQTTILSTSGFPIKNPSTPQGILQMVRDFRRVISLDLNTDEVKLEWTDPLNVTTPGNVKVNKIYRNSVNNFSTATLIDSTNKTIHIDIPPAGSWYYWVVPKSAAGDGVVSTVVFVAIGV